MLFDVKTCKGYYPTGFRLNFDCSDKMEPAVNSGMPIQFVALFSGIYHLNEVIDHAKHTLNLGCCFVFDRLVDLAETQRHQRIFLAFALVDRAFYQRNFYLAHCLKV